MTDLRTAAQQALNYWESASFGDAVMVDKMDALRAALAQEPEPVEPVEPVGAVLVNRESREGVMFYSADMIPDSETLKDRFELVKVYTAPPRRKPPATIDQMFDRMNKAPRGVFYGHDPMTIWMEAWRAAEQHHSIKENT